MISTEIIAHRGYSARAPENTLAAIRMALAAGAHAVEWDVQVARCGTPVLFHDRDLDRTTNGHGPLERSSAGELARMDAGSWFSSAFAGEPVPTLEAALDVVAESEARLYPEIKAYRTLADVERMARTVADADLLSRTTFISMDWAALDRLADIHAGLEVGYIVETRERYLPAVARVADDPRRMLDPDHRVLLADPDTTAAARTQGTRLAVWTVNDVGTASRVRAAGVASITTNEVETLLEWARG